MNDIVLWIFLPIVIYTDIRFRKIYNWSTFSVIAIGLPLNFFAFGFAGLKNSIIGLLVGLALLGWVYRLGGCGGGDVKFLAAIGALQGYEFVVLGSLYGFIIAGFFLSGWLLIRGQFKKTWGKTFDIIKLYFLTGIKQPADENVILDMPYGVFLSIGMIVYRMMY